MNKDMMKKNVGAQVLLQPAAYRLDKHGFEVQSGVTDEWWMVQSVSDDGVTISDPRSGHVRLLGYDHIQKFTSDGIKNGAKRGFLTLLVQLYVQGLEVRVLPTRAGEALPPKRPVVTERLVEFNYPTQTGIDRKYVDQGYRIGWSRPERVAGHEKEGGGLVIEPNPDGSLSTFRLKDGLVLVKVKETAS